MAEQYTIRKVATFTDGRRDITIWARDDSTDYRNIRYGCYYNGASAPKSFPLKSLYAAYLAVKGILPDAHIK